MLLFYSKALAARTDPLRDRGRRTVKQAHASALFHFHIQRRPDGLCVAMASSLQVRDPHPCR
jgi:hypothetical protein